MPVLLPATRLRLAMAVTGIASLLLCAAGCQARAEVLSQTRRVPEKDVVVFEVELAREVAPEEYLAYSARNLAERGGDVENTGHDAPVYELVYVFHAGERRLATVLYRRTDPAAAATKPEGALEHERTLVHPSPEWEGR